VLAQVHAFFCGPQQESVTKVVVRRTSSISRSNEFYFQCNVSSLLSVLDPDIFTVKLMARHFCGNAINVCGMDFDNSIFKHDHENNSTYLCSSRYIFQLH